jgi:hypothetical protein
MLTVIAFLTTLLGFLKQIWPEPKSVGEVARDTMKEIHDADKKYQDTGDNTDLGRIP